MKEKIKRLFASIAAILMAIGLVGANAVPVMAETNGTITINPPSGTQTGTTNSYRIYKVFDAAGNGTSISYKLLPGKSTSDTAWTSYMSTYFEVDSSDNVTAKDAAKDSTTGELTAAAITAIKNYVESDNTTWPKDTTGTYVRTTSSTGTSTATLNNVPNGYYYITTSTGTVVSINSTNPSATVNDKNTVPTVDKKISTANSIDANGKAALAQLGTDVHFTATVTFGKGTKNVIFHDTMSSGLKYNNDASVTGRGINADDYTAITPGEGETFTIQFKFKDGIPEGTVATITYSAKVTSDALNVNPATNDAYVTYGDNNSATPHSDTSVYNASFTVTKHDNQNKGLSDAGFVLKNSEGKYYKYTAATSGQTGTNEATVKWVDSIDDATEYKSDSNGAVKDGDRTAFTGLANGTYTLIEKTVPSGYNKAADYQFTVNGANDTTDQYKADGTKEADNISDSLQSVNLSQSTTVVNNPGSLLPSTGGIGTTIFYVAGGILIIGAAVLLIARRKRNA